MNIDLKKLLRYDRWANQEYLRTLNSIESVPGNCWQILAHIVACHRLFLSRVGYGEPGGVWPEPDPRAIESELSDSLETWFSIVNDRHRGFDDEISYVNSKGESWTSSMGDIIVHIILHGSYHRGQIAKLMASADLEPPYTDFVHAMRNNLIDAQ